MGDIEMVKFVKHACDESFGASAVFFSIKLKTFCEIVHCNDRHNLIFELEIIDDNSKVVIDKNFSRLKVYKYLKSKRYSMNYKEIAKVEELTFEPFKERFVYPLREMHSEIFNKDRDYTNLNLAINVQNFINQMSA